MDRLSRIVMRPARRSDLVQIRGLLMAPALLGDTPRGPAAFDPRAAQEAGRIQIAFDHAVIAGFIVFWRDDGEVHIQHLVVSPKYRGRGIAQLLLGHVDRVALADHVVRVVIHPAAADFEVMAFCRARGLAEVDTRPDADGAARCMERAQR